ncbi:hypothetical protein B0H14DRAFT_2588869 [Mycena olivaceomarginata]|nr:hypothetical protein B0H14DRAFT_2588869 [Mycena olivaceomarginata]
MGRSKNTKVSCRLSLRLPTAGFDGASVPHHQSPEQLPYLVSADHRLDCPGQRGYLEARDDESEEEEANLAFEDGMRSRAASDVDIDSDVEVEDEQDTFSLTTEALDDEVLLEKLLS